MQEILYGRQAVYEMLVAGRRPVYKIVLAEGVGQGGIVARIIATARQREVPIQKGQRRQLDKAVGGAGHQGVTAQVGGYPYAQLDEIWAEQERRAEPPFLLALDCLQDPQNFGTLLRTADAVGVQGVIIPKRRAVAVTPATANASAGAVEHLLIARVTNLARTLQQLKEQGVWVVGLEAHPQARDLPEVDLDMPLALVVGSEGRGLRRLVRESCDLLLRLPMRGHVASLNAAVAGAVALYAAWRARGYRGRPIRG